MSTQSWLRPGVEVSASLIAGRGLFTPTELRAGELVARVGGGVVSEDELRRRLSRRAANPAAPYVDAISLDGNHRHLILPPGSPVRFGNHSCNPNLWWEDELTLVARRDINAGEELTNDYATSTALPDFRMACLCESDNCRGMISGEDWKLQTLQAAYGDHWTPAPRACLGAPGRTTRSDEDEGGRSTTVAPVHKVTDNEGGGGCRHARLKPVAVTGMAPRWRPRTMRVAGAPEPPLSLARKHDDHS